MLLLIPSVFIYQSLTHLIENDRNTTHRELQNYGKIQGVKIWHQFPLKNKVFTDFLNSDIRNISPSGLLFELNAKSITRRDTNEQEFLKILAIFKENEALQKLDFGLKIPRNLDYETILRDFETQNPSKNKESFIIRYPTDSDFDNDLTTAGLVNQSKTTRYFLHMDEKVESRKLESLFKNSKEKGISGIAFDIEKMSKGQLALAKKFALETMLTGIENERHEEAALSVEVDHCVIQVS